jgi:hypothetical protein
VTLATTGRHDSKDSTTGRSVAGIGVPTTGGRSRRAATDRRIRSRQELRTEGVRPLRHAWEGGTAGRLVSGSGAGCVKTITLKKCTKCNSSKRSRPPFCQHHHSPRRRNRIKIVLTLRKASEFSHGLGAFLSQIGRRRERAGTVDDLETRAPGSWQRIGGASPPRGRFSQPPRPRVMHEVLFARTAVKRSQERPRAKY